MSLSSLHTDTRRALTFTIGDSLFGIDVNQILSFSDSYTDIRYATLDVPGFIGYLDFRDSLVQVFECATSLSQSKERDSTLELIKEIESYQQAHIDWVNALEHSILTGAPFTKPRSPYMCAFGRWYYAFETQDQALKGLLEKIEEPHKHIHSLADHLLAQAAAGEQEAVIETLQLEHQTTLKKLLRILEYIKEHLSNSIHPIVIHLTKDGENPWFSIVLDKIGDIVDYAPDKLGNMGSFDEGEPIQGYVRDPSGVNFMMLALDKFYELANAKIRKAG